MNHLAILQPIQDFTTTFNKSLTYNLNKYGDSIPPYLTPLARLKHREQVFCQRTKTCWWLYQNASSRVAVQHSRELLLFISLQNSNQQSTRSKAFLKSIKH